MVGNRRVRGLVLVVLVVIGTTIGNWSPVNAAKAPKGSVATGPAAAATSPTASASAPAASATAPTGAKAGAPGAASAPGAAGGKGSGKGIDVKTSGAKGDGKTDDTAAFTTAFKEACTAGGTITVPKGDYLVKELEFKGPCKGAVTMEMNGNLKAPSEVSPNAKSHSGWINFQGLEGFTLNGNGAVFDGQGAAAWKANDCAKTGNCNKLPINIRFTSLTNSKIKGIKSLNSKLFHMNILQCKNVTFEDIGIEAPDESLNTDGFHIGRSVGVTLRGAKIGTGDDCVSIGHGTEDFLVENVECGPGHGISIGSLGKYPNETPVKGITVKNCTIKNTDNGVRIKTWPASPPGVVSDVLFDGITVENVSNPVIIDQEYCPYGHCKSKEPSKVKLSNIAVKNVKGTSASKVAVKLACSSGTPCTNISLANINLVNKGKEAGPAVSTCSNVKPATTGEMIPAACSEAPKAAEGGKGEGGKAEPAKKKF